MDTKDWIQYEDGSFEPVRAGEPLESNRRGPGMPDWWVVRKPASWQPETACAIACITIRSARS
ncbi:hypothetical protein [Salidesulfovibrio brasiliensis]|uniref:hypothetical protein n=1 Tax=Salidesulfovibrio brasiliensis TaxID=221711 RepID=UPI0006CF7253|nr:hypothetical protein [Salidesulfovibrio brasiliensis]